MKSLSDPCGPPIRCSRRSAASTPPKSQELSCASNNSGGSKSRPFPYAKPNLFDEDAALDDIAAPKIFTRTPQNPLQAAWVDFLDPYVWDWFGTLTFEDAVHPERANKLYRKFTNDLNRDLYGRRWSQKSHGGVFWVRSSEYQIRGVLHYHFLMSAIKDLNTSARRLSWMDYWYSLAGIARIEAVAKHAAAVMYVTKYVIKGGVIDLSPNLKSYTRQKCIGEI